MYRSWCDREYLGLLLRRCKHSSPIESNRLQPSSLVGYRHNLATGRCTFVWADVCKVTTLNIPSILGCTSTIRPNFHLVGGVQSSFIITMSSTFIFFLRVIHYRTWSWGKYYLCQRLQKNCINPWTCFQRRRWLTIALGISGSGGRSSGPPMRKWADIKVLGFPGQWWYVDGNFPECREICLKFYQRECREIKVKMTCKREILWLYIFCRF